MRRLKDERMRERKIRQKTDRTKRSWTDRSLSLLCVAAMLAGVVLGPLETTDVMASESVLTCTQAEHTHGDGCYQNQLTCGKNEHTHGDGCYNENGEVVCGQEEHGHTGDCYTKVLACTQAEHTHSGSCYTVVEPETTPQTTAETTPQTTAETTPETTPQTTAETTAQTTAETTAQTAAETTPQTQDSITVETTETVQGTEAASESETAAAELKVSATTDMKYAVAGKDALTFTTKVSGGTAPITVKYEIKLDGKTVYEQNEYAETVSWMPTSYGEHTLYMTVTDAAGKTTRVDCTIPVSVNETENGDTWKQSVQSVTLTGDYGKDIAAIAKTQIGTKENKKNFIINKEGKKEYYSRYGQWYGDTYEEWSAMFVSFCAEYAEIPASYLPREKEISKWIQKLGNLYVSKDGYTPEIGDLVFFSENTHRDGNSQIQNGNPSHVGIVIDTDGTNIWTVEGNCGGAVAKQQYSISDEKITGYVSMDKVMELAGKITVSETETEEATEAASESESESEGLTEESTESESETEETTQLVPEKVIITTDDVNLRAEPTTDAEVIAVVDNGTELDLLGAVEAEDGIWYRVNYVEAETAATEETEEASTETEQTELPSETAVAEQEEAAPAGVEAFVRSDLADVVVPETEEETEIVGVANTLSYRGEDYTVTVSYNEEAKIPENVELSVEEILQGTEEYESYYAQTVSAMAENTGAASEDVNITFARFFDITFLVDGEEYEPSSVVDVKITYDEPVSVSEEDTVNAVHFAEQEEQVNVEVLDTNIEGNNDGIETVSFAQESFSVVGTIVTGATEGSSLAEGDYIVYVKSRTKYYALTSTGKAVEVSVNNETVTYEGSESIIWTYKDNKLSIDDTKYLKLGGDLIDNESNDLEITAQNGDTYRIKRKNKTRYLGYYNNYGFYTEESSSNAASVYFASVAKKTIEVHYASYGDFGFFEFSDISPMTMSLRGSTAVDLRANDYCKEISGYDLNKIVVYTEDDQNHENPISINYIRNNDGQMQYKVKETDDWKDFNFDKVYFIYKPVSSSSSTGEASLSAAPEHHKTITKNENDYTLSLDVKGAVGTAKPIDILLIVDTSGSMKDQYTDTSGKKYYLFDYVNKAIGALLQQLESAKKTNPDLDINLAMVRFATNASTKIPWCSLETFGTRYYLTSADCTGGTNWQDGIQQGEDVLAGRNSTKCVIFITDGNPTYYNNDNGGIGGNGNTDNDGEGGTPCYAHGVNEWNNSSTIKNAELQYIVQASGNANKCGVFATAVGATLVDATTDMTGEFEKIGKDIVYPAYEKVSIIDKLSEYVDFPDDFTEKNVRVYKITKNSSGNETKELLTDSDCSVSIDPVNKTVTVTLLNGGKLQKDVIYRMEFNVVPSAQAYYEYANNPLDNNSERYNDVVGDEGTGDSSSLIPGFYSNANGKENTFVQYSVGEKTDKSEYEKPVIQVSVDTVNRSVEKRWEGDPATSATVHLIAKVTIGDQEITLTNDGANDTRKYNSLPSDMTVVLNDGSSENPSWTHVWSNLPKYYYYKDSNGVIQKVRIDYSVDETEVEGYDKTVTIDSTDSTKTIVTNSRKGTITVNKIWNPEELDHTNDEVYVGLFNSDGYVAGSVRTLTADTWSTIYTHLGKTAGYSVKELQQISTYEEGAITEKDEQGNDIYYKPIEENGTITIGNDKYRANYSTNSSSDSDYEATVSITNTLLRDLTISKIWVDYNNQYSTRSENVTLQLQYKSGNEWVNYGEAKILTVDNASDDLNVWSYTFSDMSMEYEYQIIEQNVPDGYTKSQCETDADGNLSIKNTLNWKLVKRSASEGNPTLEGAEFELKQDNTIYTGTSGENGFVTWALNGTSVDTIADGTYTLKETKAPAGYMTGQDVTITVTNGLPVISDDKLETSWNKASKKLEVYYDNEVLYSLPSTGGRGIYWYLIGGMLLMMAASLILYKNKCKEVLKS